MLADFKADLLVSQVSINPKAQGTPFFRQILTIITLIVGDIENHSLGWRQPGGECAFVFLNQNTDEPLERSEHRPVQHDRRPTLGIICHILGAKAARHGKIDLNGTALPYPADTVFQGEFDFRAVESAFARQQLPIHALTIQRLFQGGLGLVPDFVGTDPLLRAGGQLVQDLGKAEIRVDLMQHSNEGRHFLLDRILFAENVGIILRKAANTHQAVQCA